MLATVATTPRTENDMSEQPIIDHRPRRLLLATDGSDLAISALAAGLRLVDHPRELLLVTAVPTVDPSIVVGSGHAGPVMGLTDKQELIAERDREAQRSLDETLTRLGLDATAVTAVILRGDPGVEICARAESDDIDLIVLGTSGNGGFKRALLGSTSDHVVRNAPCPVMTVGAD